MKNLNDLENINRIKRKDLNEKNYFESIIKEAYKKQLLNDKDIFKIQAQLIDLLDKIVYKYNGMDNSSIKKETLETILNSNIYTISIYLKKFENLDNAINKIKEKGIVYIYEKGKKAIYRILDISRVMYLKVKENKININNDTYNDTILEGIKAFFRIYDPEYNAQDMKITADYPLYNTLTERLEGIEFIEKYLNSIYLENMFCNKFSEEKIKYLLYGYSHTYNELIINVFEIVLLETFACKLVNRNIQDLIISKAELDKIYLIFKGKNQNKIEEKINACYNKIKEELIFDNKELQKYIERNLDYIIKVIKNSVEQNTLEKVFITQKFIEC